MLGALAAVALAAGGAAAVAARAPLRPAGAIVRPVLGAPSVTATDPSAPCATLRSGAAGQCGVVATAAGPIAYTLQPGSPSQPGLVSRPWTVTVYRAAGARAWRAALQTRPGLGQAGPLFATVTARAAIVGGQPLLLLGYRSEGSGAFLDLDVIRGTARGPRVAAHLRLAEGVAVEQRGALVTYGASYRPGDANCCPSFVERTVIRAHGTILVAASRQLPSARVSVPASEVG